MSTINGEKDQTMFRVMLKALVLVLLNTAVVSAVDEIAYVINTVGETLSKINLTTGVVTNDILPLGSDILCYPNQIIVRDTLAYVIASGTDEIQIINLKTETTVDFINAGPGSSPFWMAFLDDRYCYVTQMMYNSVAKVDVINRTVISENSVGLSPEGIIIADFKAYIAITAFDFNDYTYGQGKVVVHDTRGDTVLSEMNVGKNPQYLARDMSGRIHVICTGDYWSSFGMIYVIDPGADTVLDSFSIGGSPGQLTIGPDDIAYLAAGGWVTDGYIYTYNAASGEVYHNAGNPVLVDSGCAMVVAYQDSSVYEGNFKDYVVQMDSAGTQLASYAVGDGPIHLDFNYQPGDFDGDFAVNIGDLTALVDWLFNGGLAPRYPFWRGNMDGSYGYNVGDIGYLVGYLFDDGPAPQIGPTWLRPWQ
jgi:DNA-binding beta-propeller fold protein YncE